MPVRNMSLCRVVVASSLAAAVGSPCSVSKIASNLDLVREADSVIRAKAVEVVRDSRVLFKKLELISGTNVSEVLLPGAFVSDHDFRRFISGGCGISSLSQEKQSWRTYRLLGAARPCQ